jgi:DNA helicase-2/ATP-dependent DNA helicase PcrA
VPGAHELPGERRRRAGDDVTALDSVTAVARRWDPDALAVRLGLHQPTEDQAAVIGAPPEPCVVVAGAGSGKTETMAARVVWLVANGVVRPDEVLGLTFTRKAASELAHRLRRRLAQLRAEGLWAPPDPDTDSPLDGEPTVSTYHAYASRIVAEHGLRIGVEPTTRVLGEAASWQLAHRVVYTWDGPMDAVDAAPSTVVGAVVALAGEMAEHLVEPEDVERHADELCAAIEALPRKAGGPPAGDPYAGVKTLLARQRSRRQLMPVVRAYQQLKADAEVMDFGDQMRLAARIAAEAPEVGAAERGKYGVVLLDEYQDTGHSQLVMLRALFGGGHPVTAVGDPCQSIYSWRGASAGTLARFREEFRTAERFPATRYALRTSFRNSAPVLAVANATSGRLRAGGFDVDELVAGPGTGAGHVVCAVHPTVDDETVDLVARVRALWTEDAPLRAAGEVGRSVAVLSRKRSRLVPLSDALRAAGIPVEVVGLGGLLATPEVRDLVATLRVVTDPTAGDALVRLLTGARWRIGPRDLDALGRWARVLVRGAPAAEPAEAGTAVVDPAVVDPAVAEPDEIDDRSIVDALDQLPGPDWFSPEGYRRLRAMGAELTALRRRTGQPLPDLVADVERTVRLDVEVAARAGRSPALARSNLDRFLDVCADFVDAAPQAGITAFLDYLDAAEERERGLAPGEAEVDPDRVQLLTVHGSKGLEWDAVFVPGLVEGFFPSSAGTPTAAWTGDLAALPYPLRGDRSHLPLFDVADAVDQKELDTARERFRVDCGERDLLEERRLAYVAFTRARSLLVCSGYRWDHRTKAAVPSEFLAEVRTICEAGGGEVAGWADEPEPGTANPVLAEAESRPWPYDPLGARRDDILAGARLVAEAAERLTAEPGEPGTPPAVVGRAPAGPTSAGSISVGPMPTGPMPVGPMPTGSTSADVAPADRRRADVTGTDVTPADVTPVDVTPVDLVPVDVTPVDLAPVDAALLSAWDRDVELLLTERRRRSRSADVPVLLPGELSVSRLVALRRDPVELASRIRRPLPYKPAPLARRGTAFHRWLEQRFRAEVLLDVDALPGSADEGAAPDDDLTRLQEAFEAGEWAARSPHEVEVPFQTLVAGVVVRGRMDAVFRYPELGGGFRWDVVDWKTGRRPGGADAEAASVQLAAYRLAWAELAGVPLEDVGAAFHYVRSGETVRPVDLLDGDGLVGLIRSVPELEAE